MAGWSFSRPLFLTTTKMSQNDNNRFSGLTKQVRYLADLVLQNRLAKALDEGAARYPVYRELRFAARIELEVLLDAIALDPVWRAERSEEHTSELQSHLNLV